MDILEMKDIEHHLLYDKNPSEYFNYLLESGKLKKEPLNEIEKLKDVMQSKKHHPEGNEKEMIKNVDINDITLVFLCDRLGRDGLKKEDKIEIIAGIYELLEKYIDKGNKKLNLIR